jgi:hypothetical protein
VQKVIECITELAQSERTTKQELRVLLVQIVRIETGLT